METEQLVQMAANSGGLGLFAWLVLRQLTRAVDSIELIAQRVARLEVHLGQDGDAPD